MKIVACFIVFAVMASCSSLPRNSATRNDLFYHFDADRPRLSPNGRYLAFLRQYRYGTHLFIRDLKTGEENRAALDYPQQRRGIGSYRWAPDNAHILYSQDGDGDENDHLKSYEISSGRLFDLAPVQGAKISIVSASNRVPDEILISANARDKGLFDLYRYNFKTGESQLEFQNAGQDADWVVDQKLRLLGIFKIKNQSEDLEFVPLGSKVPLRLSEPLRIHEYLGVTGDGQRAWVTGRTSEDTSGLYEVSLKSGDVKLVFRDPQFDFGGAIHPNSDESQIDSLFYDQDRPKAVFLTPTAREAAAIVEREVGSNFEIVQTDQLAKTWIVSNVSDRHPKKFFLFRDGHVTSLFDVSPDLNSIEFSEMKPIRFKARDGLELQGYLTKPSVETKVPPPLVLFVHGGPWVRDVWGFSYRTQWLANRGYAVLQLNFRGSRGFGEKFLAAGRREWGRKMTDDLIDAIDWVQAHEGVGQDVCVIGASYGGFATLSALTRYPARFKCGISAAPVSDLASHLREIPPYWKMYSYQEEAYIGVAGRDDAELNERSPLTHADQLVAPLMMIHGKNDPRTKLAQSTKMVERLRSLGKPVTYYEFSSLGHELPYPALYKIEEFLHEHLGGTFESVTGDEEIWFDRR